MALVTQTCVGLVDGDPAIRQEFAAVFGSQADFAVGGAVATATHGLELMSTRDLDVLLVDPVLPDEDGIDFIRRCRALQRGCEIVALTVFDSEKLMRSVFAAGAAGDLLKDRKDCWSATLPYRIDFRACLQSQAPGDYRQPVLDLSAHTSDLALAGCRGEVAPLSGREVEVLQLVPKGMQDAQVGALLFISAHTVGTHVKNIYRKLGVHSRTEAVYEARHLGLLHD